MVERARTKWEEANPSIRRTRDPLPRPGASPGVRKVRRRPGPPRERRSSSNRRRCGCSRSPGLAGQAEDSEPQEEGPVGAVR